MTQQTLSNVLDPKVFDVVTAEYREMPCLSLTKPQMQRLWGLEARECDLIVDALVSARILRRTSAGTYVAAITGR